MNATKTGREVILAEIEAVQKIEHHVETNEGTYGAVEACRKVGSGDPAFANRQVYETVAGERRATGPDEEDAPGRMRQLNRDSLAADRRRVADLRAELRRTN